MFSSSLQDLKVGIEVKDQMLGDLYRATIDRGEDVSESPELYRNFEFSEDEIEISISQAESMMAPEWSNRMEILLNSRIVFASRVNSSNPAHQKIETNELDRESIQVLEEWTAHFRALDEEEREAQEAANELEDFDDFESYYL